MARLRAMHRRAETFSGPVNGSDVNEILKVADLSMNTRTRDAVWLEPSDCQSRSTTC